MGKGKLLKFADLDNFEQVFQRNPAHKGQWSKTYFGNENPLVLELACGKAEYARGMASACPEKNFLAVDIKGNRLWTAYQLAQQSSLSNISFIRDQIDHLDTYFEKNEIDEIWITFPDPFIKKSKAKKRLTSPKFLEIYRKFLKPDGKIHLKTDSEILYEYTLEVIESQQLPVLKNYSNVYAQGKQSELFDIQTYYEKLHLAEGRTIKYICFTLL
jgi:tRNA (guanine-N7-)-methyltransferase